MRWLILSSTVAMLHAQSGLEYTSPLGMRFHSLPDPKGVVAAAEKRAEADPKNAKALLDLEKAQVSVWQDREAVATCGRVLALTPDDAAVLTERGHRELPLREFKQARTDLMRSAALDSQRMDTFYHLGLAHYFLGEFSKAADAFRRAVDLAPSTDERINSTNWLYASLRRAKRDKEAAAALAAITPDMTNTEPHTRFYLNLIRFFQGRMTESDAIPPQPAAGSDDTEAELAFDTVTYGIGNWHVYNGEPDKARRYFERIVKGRVWITWGFVGAEIELLRSSKNASVTPRTAPDCAVACAGLFGL